MSRLPICLVGKTWSTPDGDVTSGHLAAVLDAVQSGAQRSSAIPGALGNCDRRVDRATQLLRNAGLIELRYAAGNPRKQWFLTKAGAK
jgi:hypothetical protein